MKLITLIIAAVSVGSTTANWGHALEEACATCLQYCTDTQHSCYVQVNADAELFCMDECTGKTGDAYLQCAIGCHDYSHCDNAYNGCGGTECGETCNVYDPEVYAGEPCPCMTGCSQTQSRCYEGVNNGCVGACDNGLVGQEALTCLEACHDYQPCDTEYDVCGKACTCDE